MSAGLRGSQGILLPFLYPCFVNIKGPLRSKCPILKYRKSSALAVTATDLKIEKTIQKVVENPHTNQQSPDDFTRTTFADRATITVFAGSGGHGCISFLREKYIDDGPPNGGDGGTGGNVYIQAVRGETSLHKLARRNILRAGRGKNGQGKAKGGERGEDVIIQVPVGTVVREIERIDPVALDEKSRMFSNDQNLDDAYDGTMSNKINRDKWLLHPALTSKEASTAKLPRLPRARKSALAAMQVAAPVSLDLSKPTETPLLLAAGATGGLGNPHFVSQMVFKPKYATKGDEGMKLTLELELKLLADVGLVGLPNAGKSTLLRALSRSRARIGNWAFTTLQPNIGTAILDDHKGRPIVEATFKDGEPRTKFTIADIPGLVKDAHLDRGLGISFLRHVERARVLAFVIDLSEGDAILALKALWKEVKMYELMKTEEAREKSELQAYWSPYTSPEDALANRQETIIIRSGPTFENPLAPEKISIADKPWFVVASKADMPGTEENYLRLKEYVEKVTDGSEEHPSQQAGAWAKRITAIPVSAINNQGTKDILKWTTDLLDD
ncbi:putative GTP-binding protein P8A3.11c, mitochondrial [Golovinomyces cichoracearum]|uniref:Putative GTP-binding protein P8A3.11c, mitochondrial n=1 Tax=Golovinomyces cichoracearum TaxID=62708 RepID=A0A420HK85_9PEZI|nr:putative GTP-binding protein P8A3.11c, mitochondrial [Golovinomyces cichoracearum]